MIITRFEHAWRKEKYHNVGPILNHVLPSLVSANPPTYYELLTAKPSNYCLIKLVRLTLQK